MTEQSPHIPVLLSEVLEALSPVDGMTIIDGTYGAGGYSRAIADMGASVIGIDRDPTAIETAKLHAETYDITPVYGRFGDMVDLLREHNITKPINGIVLDIGVSSMQIDDGARGFSFMHDGPLDMRMGDTGPTAADIVNTYDEEELANIIFQYGEERRSRRIAKRIVEERVETPFETTGQLAKTIKSAVPPVYHQKKGAIHPATRSFQALRIAVNEELLELRRALVAAEELLEVGGILAVVTFHSLEDRIVKKFMSERSGKTSGGSRYAPQESGPAPSFKLITRKPVSATATEIEQNPRSRSAKLRAAVRLDNPTWGRSVERNE